MLIPDTFFLFFFAFM